MNLTKVKKGNYYYGEYSSGTSSIVFCQEDGNFRQTQGVSKNTNNYFPLNSWSCHFNIREATEEERNWLNECIKQNKFVSFDKVPQQLIYELW